MLVDQTGFAAFEQLKELGSNYRDVSPYKEPIKGFLQKGERITLLGASGFGNLKCLITNFNNYLFQWVIF